MAAHGEEDKEKDEWENREGWRTGGGSAESDMDIEKRVMMVEHEVACVSHNTTSTQTCVLLTALSPRGTWVIHMNNYSNHHIVLFQAAATATTNAYLLQDKQK